MIERIANMPPGTIGLRGFGRLTKADYTEVLEPALDEGIASGEMRLLFELPSFDGLEPGAWTEDVKTGLHALRAHSAWKRLALVTDVEWVAKTTRAFAWLAPGEVRVFASSDRAEAETWVAG
jgi:SpoIIAA-like